MWNKERTSKLMQEITQKYGDEIAIDGSKSVLGLEEHIDEIVAELMGLNTEIVKIARLWCAIIKRAAITEGFDKVIDTLKQDRIENREVSNKEETEIEVVSMNVELELLAPISLPSIPDSKANINIETEGLVANNSLTETAKVMEDIRATEDTKDLVSNKTKSKKKPEKVVNSDSEGYKDITLEESIWAPKKERCEHIRDITAKVAAINVSGDSSEHRIKSLRWLLRENTHMKNITEKFEKGN